MPRTHTHTYAYTHKIVDLLNLATLFLIHFLFSVLFSVFVPPLVSHSPYSLLSLGTRGGYWLCGRVEPLCWQVVWPGQRCCGPLCQTDWRTGCVWPPQSPQSPLHQVKILYCHSHTNLINHIQCINPFASVIEIICLILGMCGPYINWSLTFCLF